MMLNQGYILKPNWKPISDALLSFNSIQLKAQFFTPNYTDTSNKYTLQLGSLLETVFLHNSLCSGSRFLWSLPSEIIFSVFLPNVRETPLLVFCVFVFGHHHLTLLRSFLCINNLQKERLTSCVLECKQTQWLAETRPIAGWTCLLSCHRSASRFGFYIRVRLCAVQVWTALRSSALKKDKKK